MHSTNIDLIEIVAKGLGPLRTEVVFVGGATTSFYVKDSSVKSDTRIQLSYDFGRWRVRNSFGLTT